MKTGRKRARAENRNKKGGRGKDWKNTKRNGVKKRGIKRDRTIDFLLHH